MNEMMMKIASAIKRSKNIAIYSHINTDGDAVGSTIALRDACIQLGKNVDMFIGQPLPTYLSFLVGTEALNIPLQSEYDLLITLDCNDENRMVSNKNEFITFPNTIQIDHHQGNPNFARLNMVDLQASSTSEIIYSLLEYMDIVFDYNICTALLAGILTDTGSLKFCNAKPSTFKIVASLLEKGNIDISVISEKLFSSLTINQFQLNTAGMKGTRFYYNNKLAIITLLYDDLIKSNTNLSDAKGLTRFALEVEDTLMAILVCEAQKGVFYISLRSKGKTNVSKVAGSFGGGGHVNASGCRLYGNIEMVTEKLVKSAGDELC